MAEPPSFRSVTRIETSALLGIYMACFLTASGATVLALFALGSSDVSAAERGIASAYPYSYQGRRTASGERFNAYSMTCAHKRYPFGAMLRVSAGQRSIVCRVTDRGPFVRGRVVDLTPVGARALGFSGLRLVTVDRM